MITDAIINLGQLLMSFILDLLPDAAPDWLLDLSGDVARIVGTIDTYTVWVPWDALRVVAIGLMAFWAIVFAIKLVLKLISHVPLMAATADGKEIRHVFRFIVRFSRSVVWPCDWKGAKRRKSHGQTTGTHIAT